MGDRTAIFDAFRAAKPDVFNDPAHIKILDGICDDFGIAGDVPFDRVEFLARFANTKAASIDDNHIMEAAKRLKVTPAHVRAVKAVESAGRSFDDKGRPIILFEPHQFWKRTSGRFGVSAHSYPKWGQKPYPQSYDGRWTQLADAAAQDERAALESASWGLFQIMGFHWQALGYASVQEMTQSMVRSEAGQLEAMVRFIEKNGLADELARCSTNPETCRAFAMGYNGAGYAKNSYHTKLAGAMR